MCDSRKSQENQRLLEVARGGVEPPTFRFSVPILETRSPAGAAKGGCFPHGCGSSGINSPSALLNDVEQSMSGPGAP